MIWLTWRQHRLQLICGAGVLALLALFLLVTERQMTSYTHDIGLSSCLQQHGNCDSLSRLFQNRYGGLLNDIAYLNLLPLLVGMFWGAPLLAREYEQGTDVLAWSQSVSRRRWFAYKLTSLALAAMLAATAFGLMLGWWFAPFVSIATQSGQSRIQPNVFDVQGVVPIGYALFALALGTTAGALIRRTVPAIAATVGGFLTARIAVQALRGHLLSPLRSLRPLVSPSGDVTLGPSASGSQDWVLSSSIVDHSGRAVPDQGVLQTCSSPNPSAVAHCVAARGYHQLDLYQPLSRFWTLQVLELTIFAVLAVTLLTIAAYLITRHKPIRRHPRLRHPALY